jgi:hypothetical protein
MSNSFLQEGLTKCIGLVILLLIAVPTSRGETGTEATGFPLPKQIVPLSAAVTPRQYGEVITAIEKEMTKPKVSRELELGPGLGELKWIRITRVLLGSLGDGLMVDFRHSPSCGTGGCPMWLFSRDAQGYLNVIKDGGWGFSLLPSGGSVPDVAFYWQMGAGETDVTQYHFMRGKFVPVAANPAKCGGEDDTQGVCAGRSSQSWVWSVTPAEYDSLRREVQARSTATAVQPGSSDEAHAIDFPLINDKIARVVGVGRCELESNCTISIYGCKQTYPRPTPLATNLAECEYWPMLRSVSGWGVANASDLTTDPFSARAAFVIARRLSATKVELTRYSIAVQPTGLEPGSKLSQDACQVVSLETGKWPAQWYSVGLRTPPQPCPDTAPTYRPGGR